MNKLNSQLISAIVLLCLSLSICAANRLTVTFFGSKTCGECMEIKEKLLKPLSEKYGEKLNIPFYDIEEPDGFERIIKMEKLYGVKNASPQELYLPDTFLTGYDDIMKYGKELIEKHLNDPSSWKSALVADTTSRHDSLAYRNGLVQRFRAFSFISILVAGLVDGVNPCAIATLIFLISFLATQKSSRNEVLAIGVCFTFAVFTTYLLLGIGAFEALGFLQKHLWVSMVIKWSAIIFAAGAGVYCLRDAIVYQRTKKVQDMKNQLPKAIKMQIHKVISGSISRYGLISGALVMGFLVTLLEAVCTGQVYLPTIVLMTRESGLKLTGWLYLVFYNFLFVLPLIAIMIFAYFGLTWTRLSKITQQNLTLVKYLLAIVLFALAGFLAISM